MYKNAAKNYHRFTSTGVLSPPKSKPKAKKRKPKQSGNSGKKLSTKTPSPASLPPAPTVTVSVPDPKIVAVMDLARDLGTDVSPQVARDVVNGILTAVKKKECFGFGTLVKHVTGEIAHVRLVTLASRLNAAGFVKFDDVNCLITQVKRDQLQLLATRLQKTKSPPSRQG